MKKYYTDCMPKVSVIIPVYNVENYLASCLDSVINQTLKDIEIICVEDCSTDNSLEILEAYAAMDSRIKVIKQQKNSGLSAARNIALPCAGGEYVSYIDSDDTFIYDALEKAYTNAKRNDSDVVIYDYVSLNDQTGELKKLDNYNVGSIYENSPFNIKTTDIYTGIKFPVSSWSKIYKTDFLRKTGIKFPEGLIFEDTAHWLPLFMHAERVTYINEALYRYTIARSTQIVNSNDEKLLDVIKIYQIVEKAYKEFGYWDTHRYAIQGLMMMVYITKIYKAKRNLKEKFFNEFKALHLDIDYEYYKNNSFNDVMKSYAQAFWVLNNKTYSEFENIYGGSYI